MRKLITLSLAVLLTYTLSAQLSEGGEPISFTNKSLKTSTAIKQKSFRKLPIKRYLRKDERENIKNRYSIYKKVNVNIKEKGSVSTLANGTLWQFKVTSENAFSIGLIFSLYELPKGAKLFIYNTEKNIIKGAFTAKNNKSHKSLAIADFPSKELIIEYYEPYNAEFEGKLVLGQVGQAYKSLTLSLKDNSIHFDINCPEGDNVQLEKHAVAKMTFVIDEQGYLCSGALINNTKNDGTPYFLTAKHCLSKSSVAKTLVTHFNYELSDCNGSLKSSQTLSGSQVKAYFDESDFTLLLLDETPPASYKPYYAGWNANLNIQVPSATGIHHPGGQVKKISIENNDIISYPYILNWGEENSTTPPNTHWLVEFDEGHTEGGSSGSPLFDHNKRIIGQLHGGDDNLDFYGKLSHSWDKSPILAFKLYQYLDPIKSGVKEHDGYFPPESEIEAQITTDFINVCKGASISLKDASIFNTATSWSWTISPNNYTLHNGTTENSSSLEVSFDTAVKFSVSLDVSDGSNSSTKSKANYIIVSDSISPEILLRDTTRYYYCFYDTILIRAKNAQEYKWSIAKGNEFVLIDSTTINTNSFQFFKNDTTKVDSNHSITVKLIALHGSCSDTLFKTIDILYPGNDNIENAYALDYGLNGPFFNFCASTELNEPHPPSGDCNSQNTWCACEVSDTILDNSVWFTFIGPESGIVGINAPGFDNQLALYEVNSSSDILSGQPNKYSILAANDDYFGASKDYSAAITNVSVTPNKTYWLQVDGSACGASGSFLISLSDTSIVGLNSIKSIDNSTNGIKIYPNPTTDYITIENYPKQSNISLLSLNGKILEQISPLNRSTRINIPNKYKSGIYLIKITSRETTVVKKITVVKE